MKIERNGKEIELTDAEMEKAYREVDLQYMMSDAENHCDDYNEWNGRHIDFNDDDYAEIADIYSYSQDCNIPENEIYEGIVEDYVEDHFNDDDIRKED